MKRSFVLPALLITGALLAAGCGDNSSSNTTTTSSGTTTSGGANTTTSGAGATTTAPAGGGATLAAVDNATIGQPILVDGEGKTVYLYDPDGTNSQSQVPANIKANWPAVTSTSAPTAGTGVDASKIAEQMQADGSDQVSYNGHLLYTFIGDAAPGDASGEGLGGVWFVVSAAGDKITA